MFVMFNKQIARGFLVFMLAVQTAMISAQTIDASTQEKLTELETRFKASDKNGDGKLTLEEAKDGMPRVADAFVHIDVDKKGYVTLDQIRALLLKNLN
jgi:Ca2+-binding EF-hand superfamily protein